MGRDPFLISHLGFPWQTNEKGQVVTKTALLKQMEELIEEPGLTCCICREGYKFQVWWSWALAAALSRTPLGAEVGQSQGVCLGHCPLRRQEGVLTQN